jgi:xylulokinase
MADMAARPVHVSALTETSAAGAAVQAAAVFHKQPIEMLVEAWAPELRIVAEPRAGQSIDEVRDRYRHLAGIEELDRI